MDDYKFAVNLSELEDRVPFPVDIGADEIAIVMMDDEIYALSNVCTHEYACLSDGYVEEDRIVCPLHLAEFSVTTGEVLQDPAEENLKTYLVKIVDDQVLIKI